MSLTLQAKGRQTGGLNQKGTVRTNISGICIEAYMNTEFWWEKRWVSEESGM